MILECYFDGGNKADSSQHAFMSLAVVCGLRDDWELFERDWERNLQKYGVAYLHTTDAVHRKGSFEGWYSAKSDKFLKDCVKVIARHHARLSIAKEPGRFGIFCYVVGLVLKDFIEAAEANPSLSKNANEACLRQAVSQVINWSNDQAACDECHFFFDQGEPFYGHLHQISQSKKARREGLFLKKITSTKEADSRKTVALQVADLFAWGVCHRLQSPKRNWHTKLLNIHYYWHWIDKTNVNDINTVDQAAFLSWNVPKRPATK